MSGSTLAAFGRADAAIAAMERLTRDGFIVVDALTPFPVAELCARPRAEGSPIRPVMALAGFGTAAVFFALEVYSQVYAYPLDAGGRPLNSWPVYPLVPFEVGTLAAAVAGFIVFLWRSGLPRLHHPLFAMPGIERATQDRFFLIVDDPASEAEGRRLRRALFAAGALSVGEAGR